MVCRFGSICALRETALALFSFDRYSEGMLGKALLIIAVISGVILTIIVNATTPASAGAFGILAVFMFAYLLLLSVLTFVLYAISRLLSLIARTFATRRPVEVISLRKAYYYSTIIALAPIIIISMQSVGGVGVYEFGLIVLLVLIGCVYVTKRTS